MSQVAEALKPKSCEIDGNTARLVFDRHELKSYLENTEDAILWVEDPQGNCIPIRVEFLRQSETEFQKASI